MIHFHLPSSIALTLSQGLAQGAWRRKPSLLQNFPYEQISCAKSWRMTKRWWRCAAN